LDLYADLAALAAAVPLSALPRRHRDFTLSAADAARLRGRPWRRVLDAFGSARDGISRPLALGFTTLGLVGLVLTAAPAVLPMAGIGAAGASAAPYAEMGLERATATDGAGAPLAVPGVGDAAAEDVRDGLVADDRTPLLVVSGAFLGAGGIILGARALARRREPVR
jgi:hypothetical protein